ncbi:MAG: hypothetical protein AAGA28_18295 [Pseudomonadota bacterium]
MRITLFSLLFCLVSAGAFAASVTSASLQNVTLAPPQTPTPSAPVQKTVRPEKADVFRDTEPVLSGTPTCRAPGLAGTFGVSHMFRGTTVLQQMEGRFPSKLANAVPLVLASAGTITHGHTTATAPVGAGSLNFSVPGRRIMAWLQQDSIQERKMRRERLASQLNGFVLLLTTWLVVKLLWHLCPRRVVGT